MPEEVRELTNELQAVRRSLDLVLTRLSAIDKQARTEWRRNWWHRLVSVLLIIIMITGLLFWRHDAIRECQSINEHRSDTRLAITESMLSIAEQSDEPDRMMAALERIQTRLDRALPDRSCDIGILP